MTSLARYERLSAASWRVLAAIAAFGVAAAAASSAHSVTAFVVGCAGCLAVLDAGLILARSAGHVVMQSTSLDTARSADRLRALIDAVGTALFVLDARGRIIVANRAARTLAGADISRIDDIAVLGPATVAELRALPPGARRIVRAGDGRSLLAWSGSFAVPDEPMQRLLSLQWVAGELDAVETEAWHSMTRVLTHEMMNSLTPIVSLAESLAGQTGTANPAITTIARRASQLLRFVESYRALGDLPDPAEVRFDLALLLADLKQGMAAELEASGVEICLSEAQTPVIITGDPDLLERAISNLVRNSIEAAQGESKPLVSVALDTNANGVSLSIRDNGVGIPAERLAEIFVPFFTTKANGSGIGLTLARQIAALHGGTLLVRPVEHGSHLELFLPLGPLERSPLRGDEPSRQKT